MQVSVLKGGPGLSIVMSVTHQPPVAVQIHSIGEGGFSGILAGLFPWRNLRKFSKMNETPTSPQYCSPETIMNAQHLPPVLPIQSALTMQLALCCSKWCDPDPSSQGDLGSGLPCPP